MDSHPAPNPKPPKSSGERLQKVLAAAGFGSRRSCEELITTGRVTIDGQVADNLGVRVDPDHQKLTVDGERVKLQAKKYFLINKPPGCVCTNSDPGGRTRVIDLFPAMETRLFTVGRLDEPTEGLLLVTNDGELAHRLAHPRFQVERVYRVLVAGQPTAEALQQLQQGMYFTEGKFRLREAKKLKSKGLSSLLEIVITEGHNREVRRLFARIGHKVMSLQRVQFGPLRLGELGPAEYRPLRPQEIQKLKEFAVEVGTPRPRAPRRPRTEAPAGEQRGYPPRARRDPNEAPRPPREFPARPGRPMKKAVRRQEERPGTDGPRGQVSRPAGPRGKFARPGGAGPRANGPRPGGPKKAARKRPPRP